MSWASKRSTSRVEDMAYSLMGLFDVKMPLLYGEGRKAFVRLQEEVIKTTSDESIFAWRAPDETDDSVRNKSILAPSPACFASCGQVNDLPFEPRPTYTVTSKGLQFPILKGELSGALENQSEVFHNLLLHLNCGVYVSEGRLGEGAHFHRLVLVLWSSRGEDWIRKYLQYGERYYTDDEGQLWLGIHHDEAQDPSTSETQLGDQWGAIFIRMNSSLRLHRVPRSSIPSQVRLPM